MKFKLIIVIFSSILGSLNALAQNARLVIDPQAHAGIVNDMSFTANGKFLISVSDDKTIRIWDVEKGVLDRTIRSFSGAGAEGAIYAMALSPDSRFLAIGGYFESNEVRIIDLEKEAEVALLTGHTNVVTSIKFSKDGLQLASADANGVIKLWAINYADKKITASPSNVLSGHKAQVYDISFAPNGNQLVSASYDGSLKLWDLTGVSKPIDMLMHIDKVQTCAFSSDGKWIISGGNKGKAILWDNRGAFSKYLASIHEPIRAISVAGNKVIVSGSKGYKFDIGTTSSQGQLAFPFASVSAATLSFNGLGAFAGGSLGTIIIYDLKNNEPLHVFKNSALKKNKIGISNDASIAFSSNGKGFEKEFSFSSLSINWDVKPANNYFTEVHEENGYKLQLVNKYTLSTGFKGTVNMNPRRDGRVRSYSIINADNIAVGGDFSLKLYTRNGAFKGELKGFNGAIISIASANNRLAALCEDQTIRVWNLATQELLASVYIAPKQEWIAWTPQGYYQASSGGEKYMGWQVDKTPSSLSKFYNSSVFASKFHSAELVRQTISTGNFEIAKQKIGKVNPINLHSNNLIKKETSLKINEVAIAAPAIEWITPKLQSIEFNEVKITIKAKIKSNSKIKSVKILINGRPASNARGVVIPKPIGEFDLFVEQELILNNDINEIRIFVANQEAKMVSEKRVINLVSGDNRGADGRSLKVINYSDRPDLYILSVGISDYANDEYDLNFADKDAESVAEVFSSIGTSVYKEIVVSKLINEKATKLAVLEAFESLGKQVKPKDMVLVFIASHGVNSNGQFFIMPHDSDLTNIEESLLSWHDIASLLGNLPSNVLVFIDACKSGQLGVNVANFKSDNTEAVREAASDENGVVIMAASTGSESALESSTWEHGAFTLSLLEGLKSGKADIKADGTIYLRELDFYISERTIELTNNAQHPTTQKPSTISRLSIIKLNK